MLLRILFIVTIAVVLLTIVSAYRGGRTDDGTFASWNQCGNDREYYNQHEKECDNLWFYIPIFFGPVWLALITFWAIAWNRIRGQRLSVCITLLS